VIVSERLARRLFPDGRSIDRRVRLYPESPWYTVMGVAGNVKNGGILASDDPEYSLLRKHGANYGMANGGPLEFGRRASVIVRTWDNRKAVADWIRAEVAGLDPALLVMIETLDERVGQLRAGPRFNAALLGLFAASGVLLAGIGLYGVVSFLVERRTHEIGICMALGAQPAEVMGQVMRVDPMVALRYE
jgi:hypothetical protein